MYLKSIQVNLQKYFVTRSRKELVLNSFLSLDTTFNCFLYNILIVQRFLLPRCQKLIFSPYCNHSFMPMFGSKFHVDTYLPHFSRCTVKVRYSSTNVIFSDRSRYLRSYKKRTIYILRYTYIFIFTDICLMGVFYLIFLDSRRRMVSLTPHHFCCVCIPISSVYMGYILVSDFSIYSTYMGSYA